MIYFNVFCLVRGVSRGGLRVSVTPLFKPKEWCGSMKVEEKLADYQKHKVHEQKLTSADILESKRRNLWYFHLHWQYWANEPLASEGSKVETCLIYFAKCLTPLTYFQNAGVVENPKLQTMLAWSRLVTWIKFKGDPICE